MQPLSCETKRLLILEDESISTENIAHVFRQSGYDVSRRRTGAGGIAALEKGRFDAVLTSLSMERADGMAILRRAHEVDPHTQVIFVAVDACLNSAVEAIKGGAYHYIAKPFCEDELRRVVTEALETVKYKRNTLQLRTQVAEFYPGPHIISQNSAMQKLLQVARQIAPTDCNVVITGESGTGKELVARFIHNHSQRANAPWVAFNCGGLQEELLANELFGHEKGAYTGATEARAGLIESADGGTLFLDEIAEMPVAMQIKLLRVIQEREVLRLGSTQPKSIDIRIIAATNRDLSAEVRSGRFRQDLYYRLNVVCQHLPPLIERRDDIPLLAFYFLKKNALRMGRSVEDISAHAMALLNDYDFPGNVRELENIIERGVALCLHDQLLPIDLPKEVVQHSVRVVRPESERLPTLMEREADYIQWVLNHTGGNRSKAAEILGIDRVSLWRKLKNSETV